MSVEAEQNRRREERVQHFMFRGRERGFTPVHLVDDAEDGSVLSMLVDISLGGCCLLIPQEVTLPSSELSIDILPPRVEYHEVLNLPAVHRWTDETYSPTHKQIGLQFHGTTDELHDLLLELIRAFSMEIKNYFRCRIRTLIPAS